MQRQFLHEGVDTGDVVRRCRWASDNGIFSVSELQQGLGRQGASKPVIGGKSLLLQAGKIKVEDRQFAARLPQGSDVLVAQSVRHDQ